MSTILHISDFHIEHRLDDNSVKSGENFKGFVSRIKEMHIPNLILVFSGDVIEGNIDCADPNEYKAELEKRYSYAEEYFDYLCSQLDIQRERIVLCCGNHDVMWESKCVGSSQGSITCKRLNSESIISFSNNRFELWKKFATKVMRCDTRIDLADHYFMSIDGLHFFVCNDQWRDNPTATSPMKILLMSVML